MREVDTKEDRHHQGIGPGAITLAQESGSMKLGSIVPAGNGVFAYDCFDSTRACTYDQLRTLLNNDLGGVDASTRVADRDAERRRPRARAPPSDALGDRGAALSEQLAGGAAGGDGGLRVLHRRRNGRSPTAAAAAAAAAGAMVVVAEPRPGEAGAVFQIAAEAVRRPPMRAFSLRRMFSSSRMLSAKSMSALPPCLVLRTSGTTGQPKLVYKTQQQLSRGGAIIAKTRRSSPRTACLLCGNK